MTTAPVSPAGSQQAAVDAALETGEVVRTHVLRPTWHLVCREDVRWLLDLSAERVKRGLVASVRRLEIKESQFQRATEVFVAALRGQRHLTRAELVAALRDSNITFPEFGHLHALGYAELNAVICSGAPRNGKQTYALFEERVPQTRPLERTAALGRLAVRSRWRSCPAMARCTRRRQRLMAVQEAISGQLQASFVGQTIPVLIEAQTTAARRGHSGGSEVSIGRSYRDAPEVDGVVVVRGRHAPGSMLRVRITGSTAHDLIGDVA